MSDDDNNEEALHKFRYGTVHEHAYEAMQK